MNQNDQSWNRWSIPSLDEYTSAVIPSVQKARKQTKLSQKSDTEHETVKKTVEGCENADIAHGENDSNNDGDASEIIEESIEIIEEESVQPFSAEELLEIRKLVELEAYQSGFEKGEKHGFESGEKKAHEEVQPQLDKIMSQLGTIDKNLNTTCNELDEGVEQLLLDCIVKLTETVIRRELKSSVEDITQLVTEVLSALPLNQGAAEVALNPIDLNLLNEHGTNFDCCFVGDDTITVGSCRARTKDSLIEFNLEQKISSTLSEFIGKPFHTVNSLDAESPT